MRPGRVTATYERPRWTASDERYESIQERIVAHLDALYGLARRLTAHSGDAEDLVQETMIRALRAAPKLPEGSYLKAWLFRILRNAFYDLYRSERHHRDVDSLEDELTVEPNWLRGDAELDRLRGIVGREIEAAMASSPTTARRSCCSTSRASPRPRSPTSWIAPSAR
jgi:RNA polymerase sigma-70 factor (ECF subfamily)